VESLSEKINVCIIPVNFNDANDTKSEESPWIFTIEVSGSQKNTNTGAAPDVVHHIRLSH
jgi:hypothetical protein